MAVQNATYTTIGNDLNFTRTINAPRKDVFKALTDPRQLARWWGPRGFTTPVCESDPRPGGKRRIVMRSPEGVDFPMTGTYREVTENERIVSVDNVAEHNPEWHALVNENRPNAKGNLPELTWTLIFKDAGDRTEINVRYHFDNSEDRDALIKLGMTEGWSQSLDKLNELFLQVQS